MNRFPTDFIVRCRSCRHEREFQIEDLRQRFGLKPDALVSEVFKKGYKKFKCGSCQSKKIEIHFAEGRERWERVSSRPPRVIDDFFESGREKRSRKKKRLEKMRIRQEMSQFKGELPWKPPTQTRPSSLKGVKVGRGKSRPSYTPPDDGASNEWFSRNDWKKLRSRQYGDLKKRSRE